MRAGKGTWAGTVARTGGAAAVAGAVLGGMAVTGAVLSARKALTPESERPDDVEIVASTALAVTLRSTPTTVRPGRYGLWLAGGAGHARIGQVLATDEAAGTVTRAVLGVDRGRLTSGPARWNSYFFAGTPQQCLGLPTEHVEVPGELGGMPAWVVPGRADGPFHDTWAVLVHGRAAWREETVRAIPTLHELGITCLSPTYRNDDGAPRGLDGRYALGLSEWRDIDAALTYALHRGAARIVLVGWSMGGAIVLQLLAHSAVAHRVEAVVLDGPVVDWAQVLRTAAAASHIPWPVGALAAALMRHPRHARMLLGVHEPVDLARTDWVAQAGQLRHPMLIIHSSADDVVPNGPSLELAVRRPDLVTVVDDEVGGHCQEWNVEPQRWDALVREHLVATMVPAGPVPAPAD